MKKIGFLGAFAFGLMIGFSQAHAADDSATANVSETQKETILGVAREDIFLNISSTFHGPSLGNPTWQSLDRKGNLGPNNLGLYFDTTTQEAYMLTKDIGLGAYVPFLVLPVKGGDFIMGDAGAVIFHKHAYQQGTLNVTANLIVQGPTSTDSQNRGLSVSFKTTPSIRYGIPGSRFTVGSWTEAKYYGGVKYDKTFKLWAGPYVNYQIIPNLSANLMYEMEAHHNVNDAGYFDFTSYQTDLQPGLVWNITPKVMVNPFVQLFTGNRVTFDTTAAGIYINATLL